MLSLRECQPSRGSLGGDFRQLQDEVIRDRALSESKAEDPRRTHAVKTALRMFGIAEDQITTLLDSNQCVLDTSKGSLLLPIVSLTLSPVFDLERPLQQDELIRQNIQDNPKSDIALAISSDPDTITDMRKYKREKFIKSLRSEIVPQVYPYQIAIPLAVKRPDDNAQTSLDGQVAAIPGREFKNSRLWRLANISIASSWVWFLYDMRRFPYANHLYNQDLNNYYPEPFRGNKDLPYKLGWEDGCKRLQSQGNDLLVDSFNQAQSKGILDLTHWEIEKLCDVFHVNIGSKGIPGFYQLARQLLQDAIKLPDILTTSFKRVSAAADLPEIDRRVEEIYKSGTRAMENASLFAPGELRLDTLSDFFREYSDAYGEIYFPLDEGRKLSGTETIHGLAPWPYRLTINIQDVRLSKPKKGQPDEPMTDTEVEYEIAKAVRRFTLLPKLPDKYSLQFHSSPDNLHNLVNPHPSLRERAQVIWERHKLRQEEKK